jgi:hypothetical protein
MGYCKRCGKETDKGYWEKVAVGEASSDGWSYGMGGFFSLGGATTTFYENRWVPCCERCSLGHTLLELIVNLPALVFYLAVFVGILWLMFKVLL